MTIYAPSVKKAQPTTPAPTRNTHVAEAARRRRDRDLTMAERLERAHQLCAQLASLRPVRSKRSA
jgi:hypothetical protein